jgi:hypothetical protein
VAEKIYWNIYGQTGVAQNYPESDILFSDRPPWLKSVLKSGTLFSHRRSVAEKYTEIYTVRPPWLKSILKSYILFSRRPPWLKSILKSGTLLKHSRSVGEKIYRNLHGPTGVAQRYAEIWSTFHPQTAVPKSIVKYFAHVWYKRHKTSRVRLEVVYLIYHESPCDTYDLI